MGFLSGLSSLGSALISPSGIGSLISGTSSLLGIPLQSYYNKKSASQTNDYNWAMWNATNEYNTPANQMKRYTEAGLNKNLIYGQSNITSPVSMTGPAAPDVQGALSKAGQSVMDYYAIKGAQLSNDKVNAEIAGIKAGIENQNVKTMSDFWDLLNRVKGGYGSDSGYMSKELGSLGNQINTLADRVSKYYKPNPDSDFAHQLRMDKAHDALVKAGKIKGSLKRPNLW